MVIIRTSAVADIIQAVSAALISEGAARAGVANRIAADVIGAARFAARYECAPMTFPGVLVVYRFTCPASLPADVES
jgi:hypothetical protein